MTGAAAAEPRRRARPESPSRGGAEWRPGRGTGGRRTLGAGAERAGPALSHGGRLGPGRAAAPDAGSGRPGLDYALGKSPIHRAGGGGLVAPASFPTATGLELQSWAGGRRWAVRPCAPRLPSCGDPHGASCPFPSGSLLPRASRFPRLVLANKSWAHAPGEPRSRPLCFPVPCPRLSVPRLHCCDCAGHYYWVIVALLLRSLGGTGRGGAQGCECSRGTGQSPPGARASGRARAAASARPRTCARRERALTQQVTRARPRGALCHLGSAVPCRHDDGQEKGTCFMSVPGDEFPKLRVFSLAIPVPKIGFCFPIGWLLLLLVRNWG